MIIVEQALQQRVANCINRAWEAASVETQMHYLRIALF
jgi:hypothetical protein